MHRSDFFATSFVGIDIRERLTSPFISNRDFNSLQSEWINPARTFFKNQRPTDGLSEAEPQREPTFSSSFTSRDV